MGYIFLAILVPTGTVSFKKHAELNCQLVYHNGRVRVTRVWEEASMKDVVGEKFKDTVEEESERRVRADVKSIV